VVVEDCFRFFRLGWIGRLMLIEVIRAGCSSAVVVVVAPSSLAAAAAAVGV